MFRLDMAGSRLPKPVQAIAKGTWSHSCLAMCLVLRQMSYSLNEHKTACPLTLPLMGADLLS